MATARRAAGWLYRTVFPAQLRRAPLATTWIFVWTWLGVVLLQTRQWTYLWPVAVADRPDSAVRFYVAGVMVASGILMLAGKLRRSRWSMAVGSALGFGISVAYVLGMVRVMLTPTVLYPEAVFATAIWVFITIGFLISSRENRRVTTAAERVDG